MGELVGFVGVVCLERRFWVEGGIWVLFAGYKGRGRVVG